MQMGVKLSNRPTDDVFVSVTNVRGRVILSGADYHYVPHEGIVLGPFQHSNWDTFMFVTVTAVDDPRAQWSRASPADNIRLVLEL